MWNLLDLSDITMILCQVFVKHNKLFYFFRMYIDIENCPSDVYSLLDLTGNDTDHSKQEI